MTDVLAGEPVVAALAAQTPAWIATPLGLDFWIGLPASDLGRVSRIVEPPPAATAEPIDFDALPEQTRQMLVAYTDPTSLTVRAIIPTTSPLDLNQPDQQTAEIPAVNGICTARALARFYAGLIGEVDGLRLLDPATLATATAEQANGIDRILLTPSRPALGFGLPLPDMPWHAPTAFGFPGHGGSLGYANRHTGIAFGYVMNRLHTGMTPDPRAANLVHALHRCLAAST